MASLSAGFFLSLMELFVSALVHLLFGFYIFSIAVAGDLSQTLTECLRSKRSNAEATVDAEDDADDDESYKKARCFNSSLPPIVLVHGIFGFGEGRLGGMSYFAGAETKDEHVLVPDLGPLTSIHDRARELFYYLKGGRTDYGEEHSVAYGHSRFGKVYDQGNYPIWDADHPVHLVGHSAGAQVVRLLHQMLADKVFEGHEDTSEDWVLSITCLSGALNGTTRTYLDGMLPEDGKSMRPMSLLQILRLGVIFYEWFNLGWFKNYYGFGFEHFEMDWKRRGIAGLTDLLYGNSGPFATGDWILPDLTIQGGTHPLLFLRTLQMSRWRYPNEVQLPYKGYRDEDWEDNDGALNTISMTHPHVPVEHPRRCVEDEEECHNMQPGIWYFKILEADHVFYVVNKERAGVKFDLLYDCIFQRCRKNFFRASPPTLPNHIKHMAD